MPTERIIGTSERYIRVPRQPSRRHGNSNSPWSRLIEGKDSRPPYPPPNPGWAGSSASPAASTSTGASPKSLPTPPTRSASPRTENQRCCSARPGPRPTQMYKVKTRPLDFDPVQKALNASLRPVRKQRVEVGTQRFRPQYNEFHLVICVRIALYPEATIRRRVPLRDSAARRSRLPRFHRNAADQDRRNHFGTRSHLSRRRIDAAAFALIAASPKSSPTRPTGSAFSSRAGQNARSEHRSALGQVAGSDGDPCPPPATRPVMRPRIGMSSIRAVSRRSSGGRQPLGFRRRKNPACRASLSTTGG